MKKIILCLLIMSLCLSGCTSPLKRFKPTETPVSDLSGEALLFDGSEIYQRTLALIDAAHTSVYLEQTILDDPAVIDALIRQSVAGLEIRILLDQWQSANKATVEQLKNHDISVQYYPALKGQVDHINLLISDNKQALLYGQRLAPAGLGRMLAILLPEKSSWRCAGVFAKDWEYTTTLTLPVPKTSDAEADQITVATNANIKPQILNCISASKQTIDLELTEISDSDVVAALISAMEKGIQVRLIVGSEQAKGTPNTLENLRASGAQIRYCPSAEPTPLTRCYALFDRQTLIFSSSGWTNAVFVRNHEISVTAPSPQATVRLAQAFSDDWSISSSQLNADQ